MSSKIIFYVTDSGGIPVKEINLNSYVVERLSKDRISKEEF